MEGERANHRIANHRKGERETRGGISNFLAKRHGWGPAALDLTEIFRSFEEEDYAIQRRLMKLQELEGHLPEKTISGWEGCYNGRQGETVTKSRGRLQRSVQLLLFAGSYCGQAVTWRRTHER